MSNIRGLHQIRLLPNPIVYYYTNFVDASKKAANIFKESIMEELTLLTENYQKLKSELLTAKYEKSQIAQENFFRVS